MPVSEEHRTGKAATIHTPAISEDLLRSGRILRRAFQEATACSAIRGATIIRPNQSDPPAFLIRKGFAHCSTTLPDGRRAIPDILLPGDIGGIENIAVGRATNAVIASRDLHYWPLSGAVLRGLMADPKLAMLVLALAGEVHLRTNQHIISLTRFDAREKLSTFVLGIYDRLRHRELINRPTFNLGLTQEEIADHLGLTMVHVSRTLRRLREQKLLIMDRQVVVILDLNRLRAVAAGLASNTGDSSDSTASQEYVDPAQHRYRPREAALPH